MKFLISQIFNGYQKDPRKINQNQTDYTETGHSIKNKKWKEPGLIKLAYEAILAKIGATEEAEFTI